MAMTWKEYLEHQKEEITEIMRYEIKEGFSVEKEQKLKLLLGNRLKLLEIEEREKAAEAKPVK